MHANSNIYKMHKQAAFVFNFTVNLDKMQTIASLPNIVLHIFISFLSVYGLGCDFPATLSVFVAEKGKHDDRQTDGQTVHSLLGPVCV